MQREGQILLPGPAALRLGARAGWERGESPLRAGRAPGARPPPHPVPCPASAAWGAVTRGPPLSGVGQLPEHLRERVPALGGAPWDCSRPRGAPSVKGMPPPQLAGVGFPPDGGGLGPPFACRDGGRTGPISEAEARPPETRPAAPPPPLFPAGTPGRRRTGVANPELGWTAGGQRLPLGKARATGAGREAGAVGEGARPRPRRLRAAAEHPPPPGGTAEERPGQRGHGDAQVQRVFRLLAGIIINNDDTDNVSHSAGSSRLE